MCFFAICPLENEVMVELTRNAFSYMQRHSYRFFSDTFGGALVKRLNRFAAGFEQVTDQFFLDFGQSVVRLIVIVTVLMVVNLTFGSIALAWLTLMISANIFYSKRKLKIDLHKSQLDSLQTAALSDAISNNSNIRLFATYDYEEERFRKVSEELSCARQKSWNTGQLFETFQGALMVGLEASFLLLAVHYWKTGTFAIGDIVFYQTFLFQMFDRVNNLGRNIRRTYEVLADANEMTEVIETPHEIIDLPGAPDILVSAGRIEFRDVGFHYDLSKPIFDRFNLEIQPGERIALVGPSGGGKTTFTKMLLRLCDIASGDILIDGQPIAQVTQDSLRRSISLVPQEPYLFHRSIKENIAYGNHSASDEDILRASRLAHCHEFITSLKDGYETMVGERGIKLSGGERQRVAIARAILENAPILILDEATSSLDYESESFIQESMQTLMAGKTVIVIAHRLSTIRKMDRIVVLQNGTVIEEGTHNELLEMENGKYRKLWGFQSEPEVNIDDLFKLQHSKMVQ
jgi:ATP-binding cassette subfamily B protein